MPGERFPEPKVNPTQPWVERLSPADKAKYDEVRASDIAKDAESITNIFRTIPDFDGISDETIAYMALRFATPMRDCYEEGVQVGMEDAQKRARVELDRFHSIEIARLGGWG